MNIKPTTLFDADRSGIQKTSSEIANPEKGRNAQIIESALQEQEIADSFEPAATIEYYNNYSKSGTTANTVIEPQATVTASQLAVDKLQEAPIATPEPSPDAAAAELMPPDNESIDSGTLIPWTDEEVNEALRKYYGGNGERRWEVDEEALFKEIFRRSVISERANQFDYALRDFSQGIVNDGFGPRIYTGYDNDIFQKLATSFFGERDVLLYYKSECREFISEEEVDRRLQKLDDQFDAAFAQLAQLIQHYANVANGGSVYSDIKAYGEVIKAYVYSSKTIEDIGDSSAFYSYLKANTNTGLSVEEINRVGSRGQAKLIG